MSKNRVKRKIQIVTYFVLEPLWSLAGVNNLSRFVMWQWNGRKANP